jgi:hypothetical protein
LTKGGEERDDPRDRGLVHVEDISPYFLDDVLPHVPACDDERLPESQLPRTAGPFIPWDFQEFRNALLQLVELLFV